MTIKIGVPKEVREGEQRVALVPDIVNRPAKQNIQVSLETGAGALAGYVTTSGAIAVLASCYVALIAFIALRYSVIRNLSGQTT